MGVLGKGYSIKKAVVIWESTGKSNFYRKVKIDRNRVKGY